MYRITLQKRQLKRERERDRCNRKTNNEKTKETTKKKQIDLCSRVPGRSWQSEQHFLADRGILGEVHDFHGIGMHGDSTRHGRRRAIF